MPKAKNWSRWIIMVQLWGDKTVVEDFSNFFYSFRLLLQSTENMNKILLWYLSIYSNNYSGSSYLVIIFFFWPYSYYLIVSNLRMKFVSTWKLIMFICYVKVFHWAWNPIQRYIHLFIVVIILELVTYNI